MTKSVDIVLYGATGFTGKLVAEYLNKNNEDLKIALAGRTLKKLEAVKSEVGDPSWTLIVANSSDQKSLDEMAKNANVICSTVGPYAKYGAGVVQACVKHNTHYCDLTGEAQFIRAMIDAHHQAAVDNDTRIVHSCGFDSIPSDLGTYILQERAIEEFGKPCDVVNLYVTRIKGGFSGGTAASVSNIVQEASRDKNLRRILLDPYSLNPKNDKPKLKQRDQQGAVYAKDIEKWTGPFLMAPINTRIVRRTNALLDHRYGREMKYSESMVTGRGIKGRLAAIGVATSSAAMVASLAVKPVRLVLEKTVLPAAGEGPSKEDQESGHFTLLLVGHIDGEEKIRATVQGFKDPGYGGTAIMLGEATQCLASDDLEGSGILTPVTAMAQPLLKRLRDAGMKFSTELS